MKERIKDYATKLFFGGLGFVVAMVIEKLLIMQFM